MSDTLILNADGLPLSIVPLSTLSWEDSIKLMYVQRVDVLASYEDWVVRSPNLEMPVPAVMILRDFIRINKAIKFSRANVLLRDDFKCQYCGLDASHDHSLLTLDHVTPRKLGGKTKWNNIVAACSPCNLKKGHEIKMKPKKPAVHPTYYQLLEKVRLAPIVVPHPSWNDYLGWPEDMVTIRGKHK